MIPPVGPSAAGAAAGAGAKAAPVKGFGGMLDQALTQVNDAQVAGSQAIINVAAGKGSLEQAAVAMEQASLSLDTTIAVRNKLVQAYQQIWQMQI